MTPTATSLKNFRHASCSTSRRKSRRCKRQRRERSGNGVVGLRAKLCWHRLMRRWSACCRESRRLYLLYYIIDSSRTGPRSGQPCLHLDQALKTSITFSISQPTFVRRCSSPHIVRPSQDVPRPARSSSCPCAFDHASRRFDTSLRLRHARAVAPCHRSVRRRRYGQVELVEKHRGAASCALRGLATTRGELTIEHRAMFECVRTNSATDGRARR